MLIETAIGSLPRLLQLAELVVVSMQRVLKGFDQTINRLLPLDEIALGLCLASRTSCVPGSERLRCSV